MDFRLSSEAEDFRKEVNKFLKKEVTQELIDEEHNIGQRVGPLGWEFFRKLGQKRWLAPMLPREYGGMDAPYLLRYILEDEICYLFGRLYVISGPRMIASTLLKVGTEEQKNDYLPRIARGEIEFALGYTEPGAGSDVASINIRAVEDGDYFIIAEDDDDYLEP